MKQLFILLLLFVSLDLSSQRRHLLLDAGVELREDEIAQNLYGATALLGNFIFGVETSFGERALQSQTPILGLTSHDVKFSDWDWIIGGNVDIFRDRFYSLDFDIAVRSGIETFSSRRIFYSGVNAAEFGLLGRVRKRLFTVADWQLAFFGRFQFEDFLRWERDDLRYKKMSRVDSDKHPFNVRDVIIGVTLIYRAEG